MPNQSLVVKIMAGHILCIINLFNEKVFYKISSNYIINIVEESSENVDVNYENSIVFLFTGNYLQYVLTQLSNSKKIRCKFMQLIECEKKNILIQVIPTQKHNIDYKSNLLVQKTIWEKIETDNLTSWLSTLGGAFSALGDCGLDYCAEIARKISVKQYVLAVRCGDPILQARARLYYSISLIQTGKLRTAMAIIRSQYNYAKKQEEIDQRLVRMCQGIWLKLQYAYKQKMIRKGNTGAISDTLRLPQLTL